MKAMGRSGPIPVIDERKFVPSTVEDARALSQALMQEAGLSRGKASSVVMFLVHLDDMERNESFYARASQYRRLLLELGSPPWDRGPNEDKGASHSSAEVQPLDSARRRRGLKRFLASLPDLPEVA